MQNVLKIVSITSTKVSKSGQNYKTAKFVKLAYIGTKAILSNIEGTRNLWDSFTDREGKVFSGDSLYHTAELNSEVLGDIHRVSCTPYEIDGKQVNTFKAVLFEGEPVTATINKQLAKSLSVALDDDGNKTAEIPQSKGITVE